ncbi:MAG: aldolase [Acidobacteria bacterium]|nr:aldolase [Acidobacteriota bacterium]
MRVNRTRQRLLAGETVLGCAIQGYRSAEVPRTLAAAGFDYFFLDMEHGGFNLETAEDIIAAGAAAGITPLVRVAELHYSLVARLLDIGAQGIVLPRVEDPAALAEALSWMRYPPAGKRGYGVLPPVVGYERLSMAEIMRHLDHNTLTVVQFETELAMQRADELLAVPGIDVVLVGPADLSVSLGIPGQFEDPRMTAILENFISQCNARGVAPGIHLPNVPLALPWLKRGMRFLSAGSEHSMLLEKSTQVVADLKTVRT